MQDNIRIYFDPVSRNAFKESVRLHIEHMVSTLETEAMYSAFQSELSSDSGVLELDRGGSIAFEEIAATENEAQLIPTSVQQNVPAWALFAIFFIIIPLSINMVKERNQGTFVRLRTMPVSYATVLAGKTIVYLLVSLSQFILMLLIGIYLFPTLGLPSLDIGQHPFVLLFVAACSGAAAIGIGLLLGTVSKTTEQSAPFGATLVVMLAALGGLWVPVFAMPAFMQPIAKISPMNWGLSGFHDVFLRNGGLSAVLPEAGMLLALFLITTIVAILYHEKKHAE